MKERRILFMLFSLCLIASCCALTKVNVGGLFPVRFTAGQERRDAFLFAIKLLNDKSDGWWDDIAPDIEFVPVVGASGCSTSIASKAAYTLSLHKPVAVVGAACSGASIGATLLLSPFKINLLSYSSTSPTLSSESTYPFFSRVVVSDVVQGKVLAKMFNSMGVKRVAVINEDRNYGNNIANVFMEEAAKVGVTVESRVTFPVHDNAVNKTDLVNVLTRLKSIQVTYFAVLVQFPVFNSMIPTFLEHNVLDNKNYTIVGPDSIISTDIGSVETRAKLSGVLGLAPAFSGNAETDKFKTLWAAQDSNTYFDQDGDRTSLNLFTPSTVDSMLAVARTVHSLHAKNSNLFDGELFRSEMRKQKFSGISGNIQFDSTGERVEQGYDLYYFRDTAWFKGGLWLDSTGLVADWSKIYKPGGATSYGPDGSCPLECSNAGQCDRSKGVCKCVPGRVGNDCNSIQRVLVPSGRAINGRSSCFRTSSLYQIDVQATPVLLSIELDTAIDLVKGLPAATFSVTNSFTGGVTHSSRDGNFPSALVYVLEPEEKGLFYINVSASGTQCDADFTLKNSITVLGDCDALDGRGEHFIYSLGDVWNDQRAAVFVLFVFAAIEIFLLAFTLKKSWAMASSYHCENFFKRLQIRKTMTNYIQVFSIFIESGQMVLLIVVDKTGWESMDLGEMVANLVGVDDGTHFRWLFWVSQALTITWVIYALIVFQSIGHGFLEKHEKLHSFLHSAVVLYLPVISLVGFIPIMSSTLRGLLCKYIPGEGGYLDSEGVCDIKCWEGIHWAYIIMAMFSLFVFSNLAIYLCYVWQIFFDELEVFYTPRFLIILQSYKLFSVVMEVYWQEEIYVFLTGLLLAYTAMFEYYRRNRPCFVEWVNEIRLVGLAVPILAVVLAFIVTNFKEHELTFTYIFILGSITFLSLAIRAIRRRYCSIGIFTKSNELVHYNFAGGDQSASSSARTSIALPPVHNESSNETFAKNLDGDPHHELLEQHFGQAIEGFAQEILQDTVMSLAEKRLWYNLISEIESSRLVSYLDEKAMWHLGNLIVSKSQELLYIFQKRELLFYASNKQLNFISFVKDCLRISEFKYREQDILYAEVQDDSYSRKISAGNQSLNTSSFLTEHGLHDLRKRSIRNSALLNPRTSNAAIT
eukprot:Nk52_evm60s217 gene=Nk52_evmTU60s217